MYIYLYLSYEQLKTTGIPYPDPNQLCGNFDCPNLGDIDFVCGKMLDNPNKGVTNFDNILYSFL